MGSEQDPTVSVSVSLRASRGGGDREVGAPADPSYVAVPDTKDRAGGTPDARRVPGPGALSA